MYLGCIPNMIYVCTWSHMLNNVRFLVSNMSKEHGCPITYIKINSTHWGGGLSPFTYVLYQFIRLFWQHHCLHYIGWTAHQYVTGHISTGYEPNYSWSGYTISINISTWFIVRIGRLYFVWRFGAAVRRTSKLSLWGCCLRQQVRICDSIFSNGLWLYLTVLKLHYERIGH